MWCAVSKSLWSQSLAEHEPRPLVQPHVAALMRTENLRTPLNSEFWLTWTLQKRVLQTAGVSKDDFKQPHQPNTLVTAYNNG